MRIKYEPELNILIIVLRDNSLIDAIEESDGVIVSCGEDAEPVIVEFWKLHYGGWSIRTNSPWILRLKVLRKNSNSQTSYTGIPITHGITP